MRRTYLEVICDTCGVRIDFETMSASDTNLRCELEPTRLPTLHGWTEQAVIGGSNFRKRDICPVCTKEASR